MFFRANFRADEEVLKRKCEIVIDYPAARTKAQAKERREMYPVRDN